MKAKSADWYKKVWNLDIKNQSWVEDTPRQVDFIVKTLGLTGHERILDLACGFGRHSLELARRGYSVVGVDITPAYTEDATKTAAAEGLSNAEFHCMDIRTVPYEGEFDVVLNLADGAIGYLENDAENEKIFDAIARALKPGGQSLLEVQSGDFADAHFPVQLWDAGQKMLTLSAFEWNRETRILLYGQRDYAYGAPLTKPDMAEGDPTRLYTQAELTALLAARGLHKTGAYANYTDTPASDKDLSLIVCSRKA